MFAKTIAIAATSLVMATAAFSHSHNTKSDIIETATDAAFAALPEGTVADLLKPENKGKLTEILAYHVLPAKVLSSDLSEGLKAKTVEGGELTVTLDGDPKVNGVDITKADIEASNGVIHVIDAVLLPPAE